jgi:membrane-bound lytic murein transglycosylase F|tara:strand:+ start:577 stop:1320 length:744 start_codon:yes stop_codon:yes gene_type:complete
MNRILESNKIKISFISCLILFFTFGVNTSLVASYKDHNFRSFEYELMDLWEENYSGYIVFTDRIENRLPEFKHQFKIVSEGLDVHWTLIAAISYQESHWDPAAISNTGVRGMMMLTQKTAKEMGVNERTDPNESISGGAKYFQKILQKLPKEIPKQDRMWMSLAAYNLGYANINEARQMTKENGSNANKWDDVVLYLPLQLKQKYKNDHELGEDRSRIVIDYVNKIRIFYETLSIMENEEAFKNISS